MIVRHPLWLALGRIQAESVIAELRSSEDESATRTTPFEPLKLSALPNRPWFVQVAPTRVAWFPLPEASAVVAPEPSSKAQAPTRPGGGAVVDRVVAAAAGRVVAEVAGGVAARTW